MLLTLKDLDDYHCLEQCSESVTQTVGAGMVVNRKVPQPKKAG